MSILLHERFACDRRQYLYIGNSLLRQRILKCLTTPPVPDDPESNVGSHLGGQLRNDQVQTLPLPNIARVQNRDRRAVAETSNRTRLSRRAFLLSSEEYRCCT